MQTGPASGVIGDGLVAGLMQQFSRETGLGYVLDLHPPLGASRIAAGV